jgi:hypothetical protein
VKSKNINIFEILSMYNYNFIDFFLFILYIFVDFICVFSCFKYFIVFNVLSYCFLDEPQSTQIDTILKYFAHSSTDTLNRSEIGELLNNISNNLPLISSSKVSYDTSRLQDLLALGFSRTHIDRVLTLMVKEGQNTKNFNLCVDRCLREVDQDDEIHQLGRQPSERTEALKQQLQSVTIINKYIHENYLFHFGKFCFFFLLFFFRHSMKMKIFVNVQYVVIV